MNTLEDEDLYTAQEVADELGVERPTIDTWVHRGYLEAAGRRGRSPLYRLSAAFECEASRKRKHRRST